MGLVRKELIRPDRQRDVSGDAYRFRHLLIRDAAYDSLPKLERAELHEQFADWLERGAGDRLAELDEITGYHLDQARTYRLDLGPDDDRTRALALRAGRRLAAAGRRTAERDEIPTAVRLLSRAEVLLVEDPGERFDTLIKLVKVVAEQDFSIAMAAAKGAEDVAQGLGELAQRWARLWISGIRQFTDPTFLISDVRAETEEAVRTFDAAGDIDALLDAYEILIFIDLNLAHWQGTIESCRLALDIATAAGRQGRREDFANWLANGLAWGSTDAAESLIVVDGLLASTSRRIARASLLAGMALLRAFLGDRSGAEAAHLEAVSIWDELGHGHSEFRHAFMHYALDDLPEALRLTRLTAVELERRGDTGQRSTMVGLAGVDPCTHRRRRRGSRPRRRRIPTTRRDG